MRTVTITGLLLTVALHSNSQAIPDSVMRQMLTRAVYSWQEGRARDAFFTLDSVIAQPISAENAGSKVKAALWTSSYLIEQRKIRPAKAFIDSALSWSQRFPMEGEVVRVYQALSQWHASAGDLQAALRFKDKEWELRDSLTRSSYTATIDSLNQVISRSASTTINPDEETATNEEANGSENKSTSPGWLWPVLTTIALLTAAAAFIFRSRRNPKDPVTPVTHAYPAPSTQVTHGERPSGNASPVFEFHPSGEIQAVSGEKNTVAAESASPPNRETLLRLQGVELVLIRPEVLAAYQNGDTKAIRNLLNEYMAQLPFIMKTLDEAINRNETAPILLSLQHVKSYLKLFGMQATEKLIGEVESESSTEKVSKLLSRVFQVRNHCRRAADEAKSLLEKIG